MRQDVRECPMEGYDLISALGLWYHLTLEDQLALARATNGVPLMVDTHVALPKIRAHGKNRKVVSRMRNESGYTGRMYFEGNLQDRFTASFKNDYSFWPTEASLDRQLRAGGYDVVETFDPPVAPDRRFFLATRIDQERGQRLDDLISRYVGRTDAAATQP